MKIKIEIDTEDWGNTDNIIKMVTETINKTKEIMDKESQNKEVINERL